MDEVKHRLLPYYADVDDPSLLANKEEIYETAAKRETCLEILRKNLKNLTDIENRMDDTFLLLFLRVSKFNPSKALKRIESYYQQLDVLANAFKKCSMSLSLAKTINFLFISPSRLPDNSFLLMSLHGRIDYRSISFADRFYLEMIALHDVYENPINQICGITVLIDYEGFNINGLFACTPRWIWIFVNSLTQGLPSRVRSLHIINTPSIFPPLYNIAKPIIPEKILKRIFIHPNNDGWQSLHSCIPPEVLPETYGGKIKDENFINCLRNVKELDEKFRKSIAFGNIKTKEKRLSMNAIRYDL